MGGVDGQPLSADWDFAIVTDPDGILLAPDEGPPGASWHWSQDRVFVGEGLLPGGLWGGAQFAVDFVLIDMGEELIQELVGPFEFRDAVSGQQGRETFLPVIVAAFDFAFGLGCGRIAEGDVIEVQGGTELGEGIGSMGEEKGVIIHIKGQREPVGLERAGQKVQMGEQVFGVVEAGTDIVAGGIIEEVKQRLFIGLVWQPGMGTGVILPEGAQIAHLPAFDGFGRGLVAGVRCQVIFDGPTADTGAVGFEIETAVEFAGARAVRQRRLGGEQLFEQDADGWRPGGLMIAT